MLFYNTLLYCNAVTSEPPHCGTRYRYIRLGCRCELCRAANAAYHRFSRLRRRSPRLLVHGKWSTYVNKNCRCAECKAASHARWVSA